jgi:hypothetical protein
MAQSVTYPKTAYSLALIAGILMIVSSVLTSIMAMYFLIAPFRMGFRAPFIMIGSMVFFGLISGIIVLISALMIRSKPAESTTWGILAIVFSIFSFFGMGGFVIGAILGIIGGAFALSWQQP